MNARRAKTLRRAAEAATIGQPWVAYTRDNGYGGIGTLRLHPICGRAVYRGLKRGRRE